jgi:glutaredoxin 3
MAQQPEIVLYRMVLPDHVCPYGLMSKRLLDESGMEYDDRLLTSREEVDSFEEKHGVDTTPQTFVNGERIGGTEELEQFLEQAEAQG